MMGQYCAIPAEREAPDVANAGLVRPPFVYLAAILVGAALQIAWPPSSPVGSSVAAGARHRLPYWHHLTRILGATEYLSPGSSGLRGVERQELSHHAR
jgi:hypothetical protein